MNLDIKLGKYRPKLGVEVIDAAYYDDDELAPVMPAIDAVQQLMEEENKNKSQSKRIMSSGIQTNDSASSDRFGEPIAGTSKQLIDKMVTQPAKTIISQTPSASGGESNLQVDRSNRRQTSISFNTTKSSSKDKDTSRSLSTGIAPLEERKSPTLTHITDITEDNESFLVRNNPLNHLSIPFNQQQRQDEYEFIPKSVILDVYSNDPEVKRFLKQLPKIPHESGLNEQDYKCYSCRRPIGLVFGQPKLCHFDGHYYCSECHLGEKSVIPSRILCNWDFNRYPVSKRNQHFLTLISNESMFELKKAAPLLYKMCPELREIEEMRRQAFFVRSYCTTCVQDSISFELTKLIWPREHLMKQTDIYSLEDLVQLKNGTLKQVMKNVIVFGRQHVLSCVLCCQKGFICELCKSSQIIYPFDTESVHRCNECQSTYHKSCFKSKPDDDSCPRCRRLRARRQET